MLKRCLGRTIATLFDECHKAKLRHCMQRTRHIGGMLANPLGQCVH